MYNDDNLKNIQLIYEFNNDSPLFARVAEAELKKGNFKEAENILRKGIEKFTDYSTPYFLLTIALANLKNFDEAESLLDKAHLLLGDEKTRDYYLNKINKIKTSLTEEEKIRETQFTEEEEATEAAEITEENEIKTEVTAANKEEQREEVTKPPIEERLDELAEELSSAQISLPFDKINEKLSTQEFQSVAEKENFINLNEEEFDIEEVNLASETLAMILESQGELKGAIKVYKKLIEKEPEKTEAYNLKIKELEDKISSSDR